MNQGGIGPLVRRVMSFCRQPTWSDTMNGPWFKKSTGTQICEVTIRLGRKDQQEPACMTYELQNTRCSDFF